MMHHIRPYQVFQHLGEDNNVNLTIPTMRGTESLTVMAIDTLLLIAVARIFRVSTVLEIGTGLGYTALHLASNTKARIITIDAEDKPAVFDGTAWAGRIQRVTEAVETSKPVTRDMVFCDINPTLELCRVCTSLAFACDPKVIAWHDYENKDYPAQTENLNTLAETHEIYRVEESRMCFWFSGGLIL